MSAHVEDKGLTNVLQEYVILAWLLEELESTAFQSIHRCWDIRVPCQNDDGKIDSLLCERRCNSSPLMSGILMSSNRHPGRAAS